MIKNQPLRKRELNPAQVLVMGFGLVILIGAILLTLPTASKEGTSVGFINALFTATSAVCVTGLVVVDTGTYWTAFGKTVILILIQIGGLGFMTMATSIFIVMGRRIGLRNRLIMQEALNQFNISGVIRLTKYIIYMTFAVEGVGALLLMIRFIPIYGVPKGIAYGVFHSISAFCNAGFDLIGNGQSLTPFVSDPLVNIVIMLLIIIGGIGFAVILDLINNNFRFKKLNVHTRLVLTLTALFLGLTFILFFLAEFNNPETLGNLDWQGKLLGTMFHAVTPRTAGFNTVPMDKLTPSGVFVTIIFMFIGGSPGSTAGGVKTTTMGIVFLGVMSVIMGKDDVEFGKRRISQETVNRSLAIFFIGLTIVIVVTLLLTLTDGGLDFLALFFEAVSAFGTVGLSVGITSSLSTAGKLIVSATMFFGRVGPLTIIFALANRGKSKNLIRYPEGKIMVG